MSTDLDVAKTYFINLKSRTDRLEHMRRQLEPCPWPVERVEAIRLDSDPTELGYDVLPRLRGQWHFVGIWLSHLKALERAARVQKPGAIVVLEDDVRIRTDMWSETLSIPTSVDPGWEIIFLSPRYRVNNSERIRREPSRKKWLKAPFGNKPVLLQSIRSKYVCTGAHFCIFRSAATARNVTLAMRECRQVYDVDLFYLSQFRTYGINDPRVSTAPLGSDHG